MPSARKLGAIALVLGSVVIPAGVAVLLGPSTTCKSGCVGFIGGVADSSLPLGGAVVAIGVIMILAGAAAVRRAGSQGKKNIGHAD